MPCVKAGQDNTKWPVWVHQQTMTEVVLKQEKYSTRHCLYVDILQEQEHTDKKSKEGLDEAGDARCFKAKIFRREFDRRYLQYRRNSCHDGFCTACSTSLNESVSRYADHLCWSKRMVFQNSMCESLCIPKLFRISPGSSHVAILEW